MIKVTEVWFLVFISLCYCYYICKIVSKGTKRFLSLLPIISLYLFLPLQISSIHFGGITAFFIAWLANFKLLLFAFDRGPLSSHPSISLGRFIAIACLPIRIQQNPPLKSKFTTPNESKFDQNEKTAHLNPSQNTKKSQLKTSNPNSEAKECKSHLSILQYSIKALLLGILVKLYDYNHHFHPKIIMGMQCFHIYFLLELILAVTAAMARAVLGLELEPQFNEPLLSTSLQDFWGRRWNLMVTGILRPTVYEPTRNAVKPFLGPKWAPLPAVFGTFVVSAAMHELIMYYLGRSEPTFRMTWFFLLHGSCLTVEIVLKRLMTDRWRLPRFVSRLLTVGFVMVTCFWLFIPEFVRCKIDVKAFEEYAALSSLFKNVTNAILV